MSSLVFLTLINGINDQIEDVPLELFENVIGVEVESSKNRSDTRVYRSE